MQLRILALVVFFAILFTSDAFGQNSKKESVDRYGQLTRLTITEIKSTAYSGLAKDLSLENFMAYYVAHGKEKISKKHGKEFFEMVYSDPMFTYFLIHTTTYPIDFIRVLTKDLNEALLDVDGNLIRQKFLAEVIPKEDKLKVERKNKGCSMGFDNFGFKYDYNRQTAQLHVTYQWKVACDFITVINKTYKADYNIRTKTFDAPR